VCRRQEQSGDRCERGRLGRSLLQSADEQIGGERGDEREERVHAAEAAVHEQEVRRRRHERRNDARDPPAESAAEVVADEDRAGREHDGQRA
jgi:hypothetical protein